MVLKISTTKIHQKIVNVFILILELKNTYRFIDFQFQRFVVKRIAVF